jgi:plastocyanin
MRQFSRRQFLRALGTGAVASTGLAQVASAQETPVVEMGNNYFDPIGLHVEPGTTVRFELAAGAHSATAYSDRIPDGATAFDSGTISQGSFEHTFETPGTYDYYCLPHKSVGMVGRIVVDSPGGPAEGSSIPAGTSRQARQSSNRERSHTGRVATVPIRSVAG